MSRNPSKDGDVSIQVTFQQTTFDMKKSKDCTVSDLKKEILSKLSKLIKNFKYKNINDENLLWIRNKRDRIGENFNKGKIGAWTSVKKEKACTMAIEESFGITMKFPDSNGLSIILVFNSWTSSELYCAVYNTSRCESPHFDLYLDNKKISGREWKNGCLSDRIKPFDELECKYTKRYFVDDDNKENMEKYPIKITMYTGKEIHLNILQTFDIAAIKEIIYLTEGIPTETQQLSYNGTMLKNNDNCQDLEIFKNAILLLVLNLFGN